MLSSLRRSLIVAAAALGLVGFCLVDCGGGLTAALHDKDYTELSAKLQKDMTEKDVATTLGATPDKADMTTCTDHEGKQWQCRTWIYAGGKPKNTLRVVFYQDQSNAWRVVTWDMY
jgi:hypothetical protein